MNKEFLSITTPYNSEDYKIMNKVISEGFSKSKFQKSATDNSKGLWNIHESELGLVYSKLQQLFDKTGNTDFISLRDDISKFALSENMMGCAPEEKTEEDDFIFNEAELMELINGTVDENSSDSLANKHGENLKPETMDEDSLQKRHLAGQREKDAPLGQHAPHSQATIEEQGDNETKLVYSGF